MSTNWYAIREIKPACTHCDRPADEDRIHIGKSSAGWIFCFEAHEADEADPEGVWGEPRHLAQPKLTTVAEYRAFLSLPEVRVEDEYGDVWTPEAFWERAEATKKGYADGKPPYDWETAPMVSRAMAHYIEYMGDKQYTDEGFRFAAYEFS